MSQTAVLAALRSHDRGLTTQDLVKKLGISKNSVTTNLRGLLKLRLIIRTGHSPREFRYHAIYWGDYGK